MMAPRPHKATPSHSGAAFVKDSVLASSSKLLLSIIGYRTVNIGASYALARLYGTSGSQNTLHITGLYAQNERLKVI